MPTKKIEKPNNIKQLKKWRKYVEYKISSIIRKTDKSGYSPKRSALGSRYDLNLRYSYAYANMWIDHKSLMLKDMAEHTVTYKITGSNLEGSSPYSLAMLILFEWLDPDDHLNDPKKVIKENKKRSKYSKSLEYAYLHQVPARFVSAFISSAGGHDIIAKKLAQGHREYWLSTNILEKQRDQLEDFIG